MQREQLVGIALALVAGSGLLSGLLGRRSTHSQVLATLVNLAGCLLLLGLAIQYWWSLVQPDSPENLDQLGEALKPWFVTAPSPIAGIEIKLGIDSLSLLFLLPILVISSLGSIYALSYWKPEEHPENGLRQRFFWGTLSAGMITLVLARNSVAFLIGWEGMAVSAFFLVGSEDRDEGVRAAAWLYIATSHVATLTLFALFALLHHINGTYDFVVLQNATPAITAVVLALSLIGFGIKAGLMPVHFWLPSAHAMAPSHVSAFMSGMVIKTGIYGLVRMGSLIPDPPAWWGAILLSLGTISAVLGIAYAVGQRDVKRMLAYSSVENIGIISMGLGLAFLGRSLHRGDFVVLGLSGALLHVWNHSLFKGLMFLTAGSIIHGTHTREMDKLGALSRKMPWTSLAFLIGSVAICALPPLNGFISELFIYLGLFRSLFPGEGQGNAISWAAFAAPGLALTGALALACFSKAFSVIFIGAPRSEAPVEAHESEPAMLLPMGILAAGCLAIGLFPTFSTGLLDKCAESFTEHSALPIKQSIAAHDIPVGQIAESQHMALISFGDQVVATRGQIGETFRWLVVISPVLAISLIGGLALLQWRLSLGKVGWSGTWGCGYAAPETSMQYTTTSFGQMLVEWFTWALPLQIRKPVIDRLFPANQPFESRLPDGTLQGVVEPAASGMDHLSTILRILQNGSIQVYLLYFLATLLLVPLIPWVWDIAGRMAISVGR
jgi:hydrogenase-4 component B